MDEGLLPLRILLHQNPPKKMNKFNISQFMSSCSTREE